MLWLQSYMLKDYKSSTWEVKYLKICFHLKKLRSVQNCIIENVHKEIWKIWNSKWFSIQENNRFHLITGDTSLNSQVFFMVWQLDIICNSSLRSTSALFHIGKKYQKMDRKVYYSPFLVLFLWLNLSIWCWVYIYIYIYKATFQGHSLSIKVSSRTQSLFQDVTRNSHRLKDLFRDVPEITKLI